MLGRQIVSIQLGLLVAVGLVSGVARSGAAQERSPLPPILKEETASQLEVYPGLGQPLQSTQEDLGELKTEVKTEILRVSDLNRPATSVKEWVAQMEAAMIQVTGVSLNRTNTGLEIVHPPAEGKPLQVDASKFRTEGNNLIADIPNATLVLSQGQPFVAENPTVDIATVQVVQQEGGSIRVSVVGKEALPQTEVTLRTGGLAYSLNPKAEDDELEVVVTGEGQDGYRVPNTSVGTRTNTPLRDIPQSIQIVPQEILRD